MNDRTYIIAQDKTHVICRALRKKGYTDGTLYFNAPLSKGATGWYYIVGMKETYLGYNVEQALGGVARMKPFKPKESYGF